MSFFFTPRKRSRKSLNQLVDKITREFSTNRYSRDLPQRNRSTVCDDFLAATRSRTRKLLQPDYDRRPYNAHTVLAIHDSPHFREAQQEPAMLFMAGTKSITPDTRSLPLTELIMEFGRDEVIATIKWLARELFARRCCYLTKGIYLRSHFLRQCALQRWALDAEHAPPENYEAIIVGLIEAGIVRPVAFHRAHGNDYPAFGIVGNSPARSDD
jgi:hypothetical protein